MLNKSDTINLSERMLLSCGMPSVTNHGSCDENGYSQYATNNNDLISSKSSDSQYHVAGVKVNRQNTQSLRKPIQRQLRLVEKDGRMNVRSKHIPGNHYLQHLFTTIIDARWIWMMTLFFFSI